MTGKLSSVPPGTVADGGSPGSMGSGTFPFAGVFNHSAEGGTAPKAYLNFIVFDRNFDPIIEESGFIRITTACRKSGSNVPHDKLERSGPLVIKQAGYVYIYITCLPEPCAQAGQRSAYAKALADTEETPAVPAEVLTQAG